MSSVCISVLSCVVSISYADSFPFWLNRHLVKSMYDLTLINCCKRLFDDFFVLFDAINIKNPTEFDHSEKFWSKQI